MNDAVAIVLFRVLNTGRWMIRVAAACLLLDSLTRSSQVVFLLTPALMSSLADACLNILVFRIFEVGFNRVHQYTRPGNVDSQKQPLKVKNGIWEDYLPHSKTNVKQ